MEEIFVNPDGIRIGYLNYLGQKKFIFIHETKTGELLHKIDVSPVFLDCFPSNIGWLPDGERLFFPLDTGDVHTISKESYKKVGTYIIKGDGTGLVKLPENLILFPQKEGFQRVIDTAPHFIGVLLGGALIFRDFRSQKAPRGILLT